MKTPRLLAGVMVSLFVTAGGVLPAAAKLPQLGKQPWMGYFAAFANKYYQFGITAQGTATLTPLNDKGQAVGTNLEIPVEIVVAEIQPSGQITVKPIQPETLTSEQPATDKLEKVVIRGKVVGDASFELTAESVRGRIALGGRVLDPGTLTKIPLRFLIRLKFPNFYATDKKDKKDQTIDEKEDAQIFAKKISNDHIDIDLNWTHGSRRKITLDKTEYYCGYDVLHNPHVAAAEIEVAAYQGKKIHVTAPQNSAMALTAKPGGPAPYHEGFAIQWFADPITDPHGKARICFEVK